MSQNYNLYQRNQMRTIILFVPRLKTTNLGIWILRKIYLFF